MTGVASWYARRRRRVLRAGPPDRPSTPADIAEAKGMRVPGERASSAPFPYPAGLGRVEPGRRAPVEDTEHDRSQAPQAARPRPHAQDRRALHRRAPPRRATPTPSWELRGGVHADTAAFANVLANLGVVAPHTGEPLTEAMVLGVGGGLGAGYILWEFESHQFRSRVLTLGFRRQWQYPARWARGTAERLGLHAELHETGGAKGAAAALDAQLERGLPAIVWIDAVHARPPPRAGVAQRLRRPAAGRLRARGRPLRDRRPLGGADHGARRAARGGARRASSPTSTG